MRVGVVNDNARIVDDFSTSSSSGRKALLIIPLGEPVESVEEDS